MAATDLITSLLRYPCDNLSKNEKALLEMIAFSYVYQELQAYFLRTFHEFCDNELEGFMLNGLVIRNLINDLISSNEYSIEAIACYTGYPEDVIYDLAGGMNLNPTLTLSTKIIELHAISRREFYDDLIKRILNKFNHA